MTVTDPQLATVLQLRSEIEGIERESRDPAATQPEAALSYSFGILSSLFPFSSAEQTVAEIAASIRTTLAKLAPVAMIENSSDGMTVKSVINYTGRVASVWSNSSSPTAATALAHAHLASLEKAYALRAAFAGAIAAAGNTLVSISLIVSNPLTVLRAPVSARALKQALDRLAAAIEATV
ncbi:MAG: hypothetical protein ACLPY1_11850 [Terracidiphilus sp.]